MKKFTKKYESNLLNSDRVDDYLSLFEMNGYKIITNIQEGNNFVCDLEKQFESKDDWGVNIDDYLKETEFIKSTLERIKNLIDSNEYKLYISSEIIKSSSMVLLWIEHNSSLSVKNRNEKPYSTTL